LGNDGWGAQDIEPYLHKFQTFSQPSKETEALFDLEQYTVQGDAARINDGPIQTGIFNNLGPLERDFVKTFKTMGSDSSRTSPVDGVTRGAYPVPATVDPKTAERSYAATGYYLPIYGRKNLHLLTNAHVSKILFQGNRAIGVRFIRDSEVHDITAASEVILSAGAIQSPQILELSGIGSVDILREHDITPVVINEAVGSNLQDHLLAAIPFSASHPNPALFSDPTLVKEAMEEYGKTASGPLSKFIGTSAFVSLSDILSASGDPELDTQTFLYRHLPAENVLSRQEQVLKELLEHPQSSSTQFLVIPDYLRPASVREARHTFIMALMHPFSRGSVHITSSDPLLAPLIDPKYLSYPFDREVLARSMQYAEEVLLTSPLSSHVLEYERKFTKREDAGADLDAAKEYLKVSAKSIYHPCGTCAMLPRNEGGVVDTEFKVYGTKGLRVVDASVFPVVPQGNPQTLVYAVAERAADIIKASLTRVQ